jgi:allantoin racemase
MTAKIGEAAKSAAAPGTEVAATQPAFGPASIEGVYDGAFAVPGVLAEIAGSDADAFVIACFDDTGLDAARSLTAKPVIGIGEAAFHVASLVAHRFTVVTTLSRSIPVLQRNLETTGLASRCAAVRASDIPVLALEDTASGAAERISAEIEAALRDDRADGIVLGCAGMADLAARLSERHGVPVVEGVSAAVKLTETLVSLGLRTSKSGFWQAPLPKAYGGIFAAYGPKA